jgi:hypothetical protein
MLKILAANTCFVHGDGYVTNFAMQTAILMGCTLLLDYTSFNIALYPVPYALAVLARSWGTFLTYRVCVTIFEPHTLPYQHTL